MLRKVFIVGLVFGALGMGVTGLVSSREPVSAAIRLTPRHWFVPHMWDGQVRLFWLHARTGGLFARPWWQGTALWIAGCESTTCGEFGDRQNGRAVAFPVPIARRGQLPPFGFIWGRSLTRGSGWEGVLGLRMTVLRAPVWVLVVAMLAYPTLAFVRGPVRRNHRRRHNRCTTCGYSLTGLVLPRCPECGQATTEAA